MTAQPSTRRSGPGPEREPRAPESSRDAEPERASESSHGADPVHGVGRSDIADAERMRIGREFHDGIGQKLTSVSIAASILLEKLEVRGLAEADDARRLLRIIRETVRDARNLARGLNPSALLNKGLENAIEELLMQVRETTPLTATLQVSDWQYMSDEQRALHVFRIVQEAVHNAVKHSGGSEIAVNLTVRDGSASVDIVDDGQGLPDDFATRGGMGLTHMRQRANALRGSLITKNHSGGGTIVRCTYPVARSDRGTKARMP